MQKYIIFDLDDTLSDTHHRSSVFDFNNAPDDAWEEYHKSSKFDPPTHLCNLVKSLDPERIVIFSGRGDISRTETNNWLEINLGFIPEFVFLRPKSCRMKNEQLKILWAESIGLDKIEVVFDDNKAVIDAFDAVGVDTCLVKVSTHVCEESR